MAPRPALEDGAGTDATRGHRLAGWLVQPVLAGLLSGAAAKLADLAAGPVGLLGTLGTFLGPWVALVVYFAWRAPTRWLAPAGASSLLLASLATYYATYRIVDGNVDPLVVVFWVTAALTAAPLLAGLVARARDPSWLGAAAAAFPAGLLLGEGLVAAARAAGPFAQPAFFVVAGFDLAAALLVLRWLAYPGGQRRALGLLPLFTLVGVGVTYLPRLYVVMILGGG